MGATCAEPGVRVGVLPAERTTLLDDIAAEFGADVLNEQSIEQISGHAADRRRLSEAVWRWRSTASLPSLPPGGIRPLVEHVYGVDVSGTWDASTLPGRWSWGIGGNRTEFLSLLKYHLLYCDSVALRDPFALVPPGRDPLRRVRGAARQQLSDIVQRGTANDLRALAALSSLIREDVVLLVPRRHALADRHHVAEDVLGHTSLSAYTERLSPLPPFEADLARYDALLDEDTETGFARRVADKRYAYLWASLARVLDALAGLENVGQRADLYLPDHNSRVALELLLSHSGATTFGDVQAHGSALLPELLKIYVPGFGSSLTVEDIIAIRREGAFARWRVLLANALGSIALTGDDLLRPAAPSRHALGEQLAAATHEMRVRVEKSAALSALSRAPVDLTIATAAAGAGALITGDAPATLGSAAAAVAAQLVVDWWRGRAQEGDQLVLRHAAVFQPEGPAS